MKTYDILKNIALAAVIMAVSVQCAKEEITPDEPQGSGKTVTLTVRSAGPDTRTWLGEGGKVMWSDVDRIIINGSYYDVIPDENDPSSATVSGVYESSEYMASYPDWREDENNFIVTVSQEQDYGDPADAQMNLMEINPMLGYTTGSELVFHNMAALIRLGITGNGEQIERITLVRNDGEPVTGEFLVPKDDVKSGEFADTYDSFISNEYYQPSMYVTLDGAYTELGPEPAYFYLAVAPDAYPEGFTVYVRDSEGNYAIQSTYGNEDIFRSTITSKEPFVFKAFEGTPELSIDGTGPISLSCTVSGHHGAYINAVAVPKTQWDEYYAEDPVWGVENVLCWEGDIYQIGADGTVSFEMDKAYNDSGMEANMTPETEYVIAVGYVDLRDINYISNTGVYAEAATSAATGENPVLTASLAPGNRYDRLAVSIHAPEAASVSYALVSAADYGRYQSEGLDDAAIIGQCGRMMEGEILEAATGTGFSKTVISSNFLMNNTDGSSEFYQDTEYVLIVSALSQGGMSSSATSRATTSLHIDPDAEWNPVSEGSLYIREDNSSAYYEGPVEIERMAGRSIYRFVSPMNQDEAFISVFTGSWPEIRLSDREEHYIYLDLSDRYNVTLPPFENYIGFSTNSEDTGSQYELFLSSYGNYVDVEPYHVSMDFYLGIQYQDENYSWLQWLGSCQFRIEFEVPGGTGLDNSGSNESFDIGDEVQWQ